MMVTRNLKGVVTGALPIGNDCLRKLCARGLNVCGFDLSNEDFTEARLWKLIATGAKMHNTDFLNASLRYAILNRADLRGAKFDYCDLTSAVFCKSDLRGVSFRYSNLHCADFGDAIIDETTCFDNCRHKDAANFRALNKRGSQCRERNVDATPPVNVLDTFETEKELREQLELLRIELTKKPSEGAADRFNWITKKLHYKLHRKYATNK